MTPLETIRSTPVYARVRYVVRDVEGTGTNRGFGKWPQQPVLPTYLDSYRITTSSGFEFFFEPTPDGRLMFGDAEVTEFEVLTDG